MNIKRLVLYLIALSGVFATSAQHIVRGHVTEADGSTPVEFATIDLGAGQWWGMTDEKGNFALRMAQSGKVAIKVSCVGYEPYEGSIAVSNDMTPLHITLKAANLLLNQVVVTAQRKTENATTSYIVDRQALDNQQIVNITDIATLLPGGKTVNSTLTTDSRLALRAGDNEKGNAAFGTAIEVDGQRMQNNAEMGETTGASTRTIGTANVAHIEVVPGIPSVEYGDLSNGIVKVSTKHGHTPWEISFSTNPYTKLISVGKGFELAHGSLNVSLEHTKSYTSIASPHTAYQRNNLTLSYRTATSIASQPLILQFNLAGNAGGTNSKADPDRFADTYTRTRDAVMRGAINADWNPGAKWLAGLSLHADASFADKRRTSLANDNSSSSQAQIHATEAGYFIATEYDQDPTAPIILGPTGYWFVKSYYDNKPISLALKAKGKWNHRNDRFNNRAMAGIEWTAGGNRGRGSYFDDMRYAPSWREYRLDKLPWMHNVALYAEDRLSITCSDNGGELQLMAGLRNDITHIGESLYGTVSTLSPRFNLKWVAWDRRDRLWVDGLSFHAGWGKSVKLPSFEVLYPAPAYADRLAFVPASTADGKAFYAYSVTPFKSAYNPQLKWQYSQQLEMGLEASTRIARLSVVGFFARVYRPYLATSIYTPFSYNFTSQAALEGNFPIASQRRIYTIDRNTGIVTVTDNQGEIAPVTLDYTTRNTFNTGSTHTNGSPIYRSGIDWIIDFNQIKALHTSVRLDGSFYHYHGVEHTTIAAMPTGAQYMSDGITPYQYVGYYHGTAVNSGSAYATVPNGTTSQVVNGNVTFVTHIPAIRLVISLRLESTLYDYRRALSEGNKGATRGYVLENAADYFGKPYSGTEKDRYVALWPDYYTTRDNPDVMIPFAEKFTWARDNDPALYNDLAQLVVKTNYNYNLNPDRISAYLSGNINITKEIGNHVSISFLANNFWNSMARIKRNQTGLRTSIYNAGYIPPFYYGLSVRVKL